MNREDLCGLLLIPFVMSSRNVASMITIALYNLCNSPMWCLLNYTMCNSYVDHSHAYMYVINPMKHSSLFTLLKGIYNNIL